MDHIEKKNEATDVGIASHLIENGITKTKSVAAIIKTIPVIRTRGLRRMSNLTRNLPPGNLFIEAVSQGI